jgi:hypothetical protein
MVVYSVYRARFKTDESTVRDYIGYTGNAGLREDRLNLKEQDWCKCMRPGTLHLETVFVDIGSKQAALALEAWTAAKEISQDFDHVRGGPWLVKTLPACQMYEISVIAKCKDLVTFAAAVQFLGPDSKVGQHMARARFVDTRTLNQGQAKAKARPSPKPKPKAKAKAKAKARAKILAQTKIVSQADGFIRAKRSGSASGESGHGYRQRNGVVEGTKEFDVHKYGKLGRKAARAKHRVSYVLKKPASK